MKRRVYRDSVPWEEALELLNTAWREAGGGEPLEGVEIATEEALERITAEPVFARLSAPHYHGAAMDGISVLAEDTFGASEVRPRQLVEGRDYDVVDTGDPLPRGRNAVIMVEHIHPVSEGVVEIVAAASPWQHVRTMGEDVVTSELLVPANHELTAVDIGALLGAGVDRVKVRRKPRIALLPTGDELVDPGGDQPGVGDIIEYNSRVLAGFCQQWGADPVRIGPVRDDIDVLTARVQDALRQADVVIINAGSSTGRGDYTAQVISSLGRLLVQGVAIRPGNPVLLGVVGKKPVLGIPGYPVSTALTFELFAEPVIRRLQGLPVYRRPTIQAVMSQKTASSAGREEFLRVQVGTVGQRRLALPLPRGSGIITSLVRADGIVRIPMTSQGIQEGQEVTVELYRPADSLDRTVVAIGSHDITLDLITNALATCDPPARLISTHVGSLAGLRAIAENKAHVAGSHLLDGESGEYNLPYIERIMPETELALVTLAHRQQGFMVKPGESSRLGGFESLTQKGVTYINRQRGAGTRILLDYHLEKLGISPDDIEGYERDAYTHMEVAAAVASGAATTGLGIMAAARALGLDFIPVAEERFELVIRREHLDYPPVRQLLEVINGHEFQLRVENLGGYDLRETGTVRWTHEPA